MHTGLFGRRESGGNAKILRAQDPTRDRWTFQWVSLS